MANNYIGWDPVAAREDMKAKGINPDAQSSGSMYGVVNQAVDDYINGLIAESQGDRDFIIKTLEAKHALALGSNDQQTAQFLETVSDSLEKKMGRIPYDYEKYTKRELEDYAKGVDKLTASSDLALKRLAEDEKSLREGIDANAVIEKRNQESLLNQRGIISGTREDAQGLAGQEVKTLNTDIQKRYEALARSAGRTSQDIGINRAEGLSTLGQTKERNIADLTTEARRGAENQQLTTTLGKEQADRSLAARIKSLEAQKQEMKIPALSSSYDYIYG